MNESRFIVSAGWIIPVIPHAQVLPDYSIVVEGQHIIRLLPTSLLADQYPGWRRINLPSQVLLPGMINAHGHAAMTLLRGYADDTPLMTWLSQHIWPIEAQHVSPRFVYDGTSLAIAEMLSSGTTCAADTYFFPDAMVKAYSDHHFRAQVCLPVIQHANAWAENERDHIQKGIEVHDSCRGNSLITTALAPHAPYTVTDEGFELVGRTAADLGIPVHLHLHETKTEVEEALAANGERPFARIRRLGLLNKQLQAVHMTQLTESEISQLAEANVHIAHCPDSNLKLASGFCPVSALAEAGVNIAVGTDGAASNNNLDMSAELRSAALLAKGVSGNAASITAAEALAMGTINGAKMLGIDHLTGSLEPGKLADFITMDLSGPGFQPVYNPISQVVYSASGHQATNVWIAGRHLLANGAFTELDIEAVLARVRAWQQSIQAHAS